MQLGRHLLMDFYGCDGSRLDDSVYIEDQLREAAKAAGAHVLSATVHRFAPQGSTSDFWRPWRAFSLFSWRIFCCSGLAGRSERRRTSFPWVSV